MKINLDSDVNELSEEEFEYFDDSGNENHHIKEKEFSLNWRIKQTKYQLHCI